MEANTTPNAQYKQVTVDVPEDRVAEFHAMFGRFLAGSGSRRRGSRGRHPHGRHHGRGCAHERSGAEPHERAEAGQPTVEATEL
jgi:hypothetical protein